MIEIPEQLTCLFSAEVEPQDDSYVIEVPKSEVDGGFATPNNDYQLAILSLPPSTASNETVDHSPERPPASQQPPVSEGETRIVRIEDLGDQGDGLTRVERGYVIIVGDTEKGEEVRIKIDTVRENVAFATVLERISYYD